MRRVGSRPIVTVDLDGVLARPPFGLNPDANRKKRRDRRARWSPLWALERWRYVGRSPMPHAGAALEQLREVADVRLVSARGEAARPATERWLARHLGWRPPLYLRPSWRESSAQYKARLLAELAPFAHLEDDPHTAAWVAEFVPLVVLIDWPRNRWLEGPNIRRASDPLEAAEIVLEALSQGQDERRTVRAWTSD